MKNIVLELNVVDWLMPELVGDGSPSAFIVYLYLWCRAREGGSWSTRVTHQQIGDGTGLSKSAVQTAIRHLNRRKLIRSARQSLTAIPEHHVLRPWATSRRRTSTPPRT